MQWSRDTSDFEFLIFKLKFRVELALGTNVVSICSSYLYFPVVGISIIGITSDPVLSLCDDLPIADLHQNFYL